jgi:hypothetical protein
VIEEDDSVAEPASVEAQDAVVVDIVGRFAKGKDDEDGPIFQEVHDWLVVIGEKDVLPALEMAIRFMKVGQHAAVWSHSKFAYGPSSRKHGEYELPPESSVRYEVTVKSVASSDPIVNEPSFQIKIALSKKRIGNDVYLYEWSNGYGKARAKMLYQRAADLMEYLFQTLPDDDPIRNEAIDIMLQCLNNITACHLRAKEFHQAKEAAVKVLSHDPDNLKGMIRAAKAALGDPASSYEEVEAAIAAAETDHPDDSEVRKLRTELKQRKQAYKKMTKLMYSKPVKKEAPSKKDPVTVVETERELSSANGETEHVETENVAETEPTTPWWRNNWRQWEWKTVILPYAFQILLPFLTYYATTVTKKKEAGILEATMETEPSPPSPLDEFSNDPRGSEL